MTTAATSDYPAHLLDQDGDVVENPSRQEIENRLSAGRFFWLDLPSVGDDELTILRDVFHLHPLTLDDAQHFGERPKLDEYDDYSILIMYGTAADVEGEVLDKGSGDDGSASAANRDSLLPAPPARLASGATAEADLQSTAEVHCVVSEHYFLTVHRGNCPSLRALATRARNRRMTFSSPGMLVYRMADTLVDSFFPVLGELDDRIDSLTSAVVQKPTNEQLKELLRYRSLMIELRRLVAPQRDVFSSLAAGVTNLPGLTDDDGRYLRDVYDHLIHLSDLIDSYRDLLSGTTDAYLSVVSNQLNVVMKQLSIIATVFLPLSFLTGFFGQNFSWLVSGLNGVGKFIVLGLGTEFVAVAIMMVFFRRKGWLGNQT